MPRTAGPPPASQGASTPVAAAGPVVGIGESLVRLSAPHRERLERAAHLQVHVGGAEMNALIGLANLGFEATWLTRLADNPLGHRIAAHALGCGLQTVVDWDKHARAPLYFAEHGSVFRPSEVLYDRSQTAMRALSPETFDWRAVLEPASAALCTGITCALGEGPAKAVEVFLTCARDCGATTVFDVNHRSRMWTWREALPVLERVLSTVDVLFASEYDLAQLTNTTSDPVASARELIDRYGHQAVVLRQTMRLGFPAVAVSARGVTPSDVTESAVYEADTVDAFGAGDAAVAAFLASCLSGADLAEAVDQTAWACAFQHTLPGDAWHVRPGDLLMRGRHSGRILR